MEKKKTELLTIIIPTFNEVENVGKIINRLKSVLNEKINYKIIFVDDNSSDGTADKIKEYQKKFPYIQLIVRIGRRGLAGACIEGIANSRSELIVIMDCDLQHDEAKIPEMLDLFKHSTDLDLVVGSRHTNDGISSTGFSIIREYGSQFAIKITQILLRIKISDPMSGFFMVKSSSILPLIGRLQSDGFKILADIIACSQRNWKIKEIGYVFRKRESGNSKMNFTVMLELIALILSHLSLRFFSIRFILFGIVGSSGIVVQVLSTYILMTYLGLDFLLSHFLSVIIAMTNNFTLNNIITFKDRSLTRHKYFKGLITFYFVCSAGALLNIATADFLFKNTQIWILSSIIGAIIGALWNFLFSSIITWKTR